MTALESWSAAVDPGRRIGQAIEFHPSIGSTNDRAWELLRDGLQGVAVVADEQTAGRGRHGRTWSSPTDVNLMVSVGFRPMLAATDAWQLAAGAGLALLDACRQALGPSVASGLALRWPNDLVDGDGRKLAGLLVETSIEAERVSQAVIGTGININWPRSEMPAEIRPTASSLSEMAGTALDRAALLGAYLQGLDAEVSRIEGGHSPIDRYRRVSWLRGRTVEVLVGERGVTGIAVGVGEDGSLLVQTDGEVVALSHGEVVRVGVLTTAGAPA